MLLAYALFFSNPGPQHQPPPLFNHSSMSFAAVFPAPIALMTVAPPVSHPEEVRPVFHQLKKLGEALGLRHLSMGMSDDFDVAIEEGATMIRIGRAIFGERS